MALFARKRINPLFPEHKSRAQAVNEDRNADFAQDPKHLLPQDVLRKLPAEALTGLSLQEMYEVIQPVLRELSVTRGLSLSEDEETFLIQNLIDDMIGFGPLEPLLEDDHVTDILVNGPKQILIEREGRIETTPIVFRDEAHLRHLATRIANRIGRRIDESVPMVDARLPDDSRINIVIPPLSLSGTSMSIRKFRKMGLTLDVMQERGSLTKDVADFIRLCVKARLNILVSGGTGAGKTTLLNAISEGIEAHERVITIEDTAELRLSRPHVVRLEARAPNVEGAGEISIRDLVRNALRMRPDRLIIGEVRGAEVVDMLQALNTGHQGSMSTIHANEPKEALVRLENMAYLGGLKIESAVLKQLIAGAIDLIIHLERMNDGTRRIMAVSELSADTGVSWQLHELFRLKLPVASGGPDYQKSAMHNRLQTKFERLGLEEQARQLLGI